MSGNAATTESLGRARTTKLLGIAGAYIVKCAICQQPWEVSEQIVSAPSVQAIQVPAHPVIERADSSPTEIRCQG
jgi:hypothetical protein